MKALFVLTAISFISKVYLHVYVSNRNGRQLKLRGILDSSLELLWFYTKPVLKEIELLKQICNYLLLFFYSLCILIVIVSLVAK